MRKIVFDNSIHLGQFSVNNEGMRIAAKNSQILISAKSGTEVIGLESFNENTFSDDIIWGLEREPQDAFYKFMDLYHSVKNVTRIPLETDDAKEAIMLSEKLGINISNALTCALAIKNQADEIHSFYQEFDNQKLKGFLKTKGVAVITKLNNQTEKTFFEPGLEGFYQDSLAVFKKEKINLPDKFHD